MDTSIPPGLFEHFHHTRLEYMVYGLDSDSRPGLRHRKDIDDLCCPFVDVLSQHQAHNFHRYTGTSVLQHLTESLIEPQVHKKYGRDAYFEEGERGDGDDFSTVDRI